MHTGVNFFTFKKFIGEYSFIAQVSLIYGYSIYKFQILPVAI